MRRWREAARMALWDLRLNPVRSVLSLVGVIIGISAVTAILALGAGARAQIYERMTSMGANAYYVYPGYDDKTYRLGKLEVSDMTYLRQLPFVKAVYPQSTLRNYVVRAPRSQARADIRGVENAVFTDGTYALIEGRGFDDDEVARRDQVCVITRELANDLFRGESALNQSVWLDNAPWRVVGVVSDGATSSLTSPEQNGKGVIAPFATFIRVYNEAHLESLKIQVSADYKEDVEAALTQAMEKGDPRRQGLYRVMDMKSYRNSFAKMVSTLTVVGVLIASISLFVGSVGLMNVMLTSVAERTREIGLRRALGARKADILNQFLIESSLLSTIGGVLGVLIGYAAALILPKLLLFFFQQDMQAHFMPAFAGLGLFAALLLGLVSGLYPASKASRLSPAESLRAE